MLKRFWKAGSPEPGKLAVADYLRVEEFTVLEQIQRWTEHPDKALADCARRFLNRDGLAMVKPPPPTNALKSNDFGEWEPAMHKLLRDNGYEDPEMYCLADKVEVKYQRPYKEEKDPENQSAVNTIRVLIDGKPMTIGQHLPRLAAVIAQAQDRVAYYVPKEIRNQAKELSEKLAKSTNNASG